MARHRKREAQHLIKTFSADRQKERTDKTRPRTGESLLCGAFAGCLNSDDFAAAGQARQRPRHAASQELISMALMDSIRERI